MERLPESKTSERQASPTRRSGRCDGLTNHRSDAVFLSETPRLNDAVDAQLVLAFRNGVTVLLFDGFAPEAVNARYHVEARAELRKQRASNPLTSPVIRDRLPEDRPINEQTSAGPGEVAA